MISIVIPAWNEEKYLPNLLADLKKQSYKDFEIIVADANSTDRTAQIAKKFGCKIVRGGMPGIGRNVGARAAKGDTLLFLDADARIDSDYIMNSIKDIEYRKLDAAGSYISPINGKQIDHMYFNMFNSLSFLTQHFYPHAVGSGIFCKKSLHKAIRGFDETIRLGEDHDYVKRAAKKGKFRMLKDSKARFCIRRLDNEGRIKFGAKMLLAGIYRILFGEIRKDIFHYNLRYRK